ncbi:hypothetical protein M5K25_000307 [Dendrobium thyrsiflorum]|uniref:RNase H type-1 domain-containing protein n=1 Tax=Dendrobium thyrsiflorum TaxID=117978 RepID=A0ABD0VTZ4_DENTH
MAAAFDPWGVAAMPQDVNRKGFFNLDSADPKSTSRSFREVVSGTTSPGDKLSSLTHSSVNGIPAILISHEEVLKLASPFQYTLVGKFSLRRPSLDAIRLFFNNFKISGVFSIGLLDSRHVAIQLLNDLDYSRVFARRAYYINSCQMRLLKWTLFFDIKEESPVVSIWISFPNLRLHFFNALVLHALGSIFGRPLQTDQATASRTRPSVARVLVEVDITKKHTKEVWNESKHNEKKMDAYSIIYKIKDKILNMWASKLINVDKVKRCRFILRRLGIDISNLNSSSKSIIVRWSLPKFPYCKLNSDGSVKNNMAGGGGIVRNHLGHVLAAYAIPLHTTNVPTAELLALLYGLNLCMRMGITKVWIEVDAMLVIYLINRKEANAAADFLANLGCNCINDTEFNVGLLGFCVAFLVAVCSVMLAFVVLIIFGGSVMCAASLMLWFFSFSVDGGIPVILDGCSVYMDIGLSILVLLGSSFQVGFMYLLGGVMTGIVRMELRAAALGYMDLEWSWDYISYNLNGILSSSFQLIIFCYFDEVLDRVFARLLDRFSASTFGITF